MTDFFGLRKEALQENLLARGFPRFRSDQLWNWLFVRGETNPQNMANLPKALIEQLQDELPRYALKIHEEQRAKDGVIKWLLELYDGNQVEMVYIPERLRGTLCISSQVGCTLSCKFCHTGTQKMVRNLLAGEIVQQVLLAKRELRDFPTSQAGRAVTNVVFMGMGEPLYNYENVRESLKILCHESGLAFSKRRVTLSTSGVLPAMERMKEETDCALALSLHAVDDETRSMIMPINKKYPLQSLLDCIRNWPAVTNSRRITFEYVMLDGVNDSLETAQKLIELVGDIPCKINLIPFNPWPGTFFQPSPMRRILAFQAHLNQAGLSAPIRQTRGEDILAACGQLKSASERVPAWKKRQANEEALQPSTPKTDSLS